MPLGHLESDAFIRFRGSSKIMWSDIQSSPLDFQFFRTSGTKSDTKKVLTSDSDHAVNPSFKYSVNGSQLKKSDISGAIFTLNLSILMLNSQCAEGARDVRVL